MGKFKKILSLCLILILAASLLPGTAMAADPAHWAYDAVVKLNALYGEGTFSEDYEAPATVGYLKGLLEQTFQCPDPDGFIGLDGAGEDAVTRGVLTHTAVKLFSLGDITGTDDEEKINSAIGICRDKGIASGYPDGTFGESDPVTCGALAVVFYRAVNKAAGGTLNRWGLKPGTYGYEELLYFAVRSIPYGEDVYNTPFDENASINVSEVVYAGAENVWNKWEDMLNTLEDPDTHEPYAVIDVVYSDLGLDEQSKMADAVVRMAGQYRAELTEKGINTAIFYDVPSSSWFYDGIMYLLNQKIVMGYGNGTFWPQNPITRAEMAAVVLRAQGVDTSNLPMPDMNEFTAVFPNPGFIVNEEECDIQEPHDHPHLNWAAPIVWAAKDYYGEETDFDPNDLLSREAMAFAAVELFEDYDESSVNLAILDRFADKDDIGEQYKKPLAYLVSIGVLNGARESDGIYLIPQNNCTRAEAGIFLSRVLQGLDKSRMKDYKDALDYVQNAGGDE